MEDAIATHVAPNITLNTIGASVNEWELNIIAFIGITLQVGVLAFDAVVTYYLRLEKGGRPITNYAFPLASIGTLGLCCGMYLCANIVEQSTMELIWKIPNRDDHRVLWIQKAQSVGDQGFGSYSIYAPYQESKRLRPLMTSHRNKSGSTVHKWTMFATVLSVICMYTSLY